MKAAILCNGINWTKTLYIYTYSNFFHVAFESTLLNYANPLTKLDLPTLQKGKQRRKIATEQIKNLKLARIYIYVHIVKLVPRADSYMKAIVISF